MENKFKEFDTAYTKFQEEINLVSSSQKHPAMAERISKISLSMLQDYLLTYLMYLQAKTSPGQVNELLETFKESALQEVSRQSEVAHEKLSDDPLFTTMTSLFELPPIEGVEGMYIHEINRIIDAHKDLFGIPRTENT